jgi:hypothetical protein
VAHESYNFHRLSLKPIEVILTNKCDVHVCNPRMCAGTDAPTFWAGQPSHGGTRNASGAEPSRTIDLMTAPRKQSVRRKSGMQILYGNQAVNMWDQSLHVSGRTADGDHRDDVTCQIPERRDRAFRLHLTIWTPGGNSPPAW